MQYEIKHRKTYDFINESLKDRLVPILDAEAEVMFDEDFTRLHPSMHWARAYRDSTRWGTHTPDIQGALKLMKEFGMEWSTDRDAWGGDWKFRNDTSINVKGNQAAAETDIKIEDRTEPSPLENLALREQGLQKDMNAMQQQLQKQQSFLKETEIVHQQRHSQREPVQQPVGDAEQQKEKIAL